MEDKESERARKRETKRKVERQNGKERKHEKEKRLTTLVMEKIGMDIL